MFFGSRGFEPNGLRRPGLVESRSRLLTMASSRSSLPPAAASLTLAALLSACGVTSGLSASSTPKPTPATAQSEPPRMVHSGLAREDDFVVRVVVGDGSCTGTLIVEDQVLTAHHCVAHRAEGEAARNVKASEVRVELGGDDFPWGDVAVRAVLTPACGHDAGFGDIAILVLDHPLPGMPTVRPELSRAPQVGEAVTPFGFGQCLASETTIRRRRRAGGQVESLLPTRFRLPASICPGDSGGPVLSMEGRVLGVISASVMDDDATTAGPSEFTRLDSWRELFERADAVSAGAEVPPDLACRF